MMDEGYRLRLRVRLAKSFNSSDQSLRFEMDGREIEIVSQEGGRPLSEAKWIIFKAAGFLTELEARAFGEELRTLVGLAGAFCRIGIDIGEDQPTGWISEEWAKQLGLLKQHDRISPNIHGLAVFPDDGRTKFPTFAANAEVRTSSEIFIQSMVELAAGARAVEQTFEALRVLNFALINPQPLAQIALCLSVVEALGQTERWSTSQVKIITKLAAQAEAEPEVTEQERDEIVDALKRGLHRVGLRQGVKRVLATLGLQSLQKEWDRVYGLRSGIFHGTDRLKENEIAQLATDVTTLCGKIIVALAERDGVAIPKIASIHFPR